MSQEYPKKGDNYGQFLMKTNGCPLLALKYRTIVDKRNGACLSAIIKPVSFCLRAFYLFYISTLSRFFPVFDAQFSTK